MTISSLDIPITARFLKKTFPLQVLMDCRSAVHSIKKMELSLRSGAVCSKSVNPTHLDWQSQKMQMFLRATRASASRSEFCRVMAFLFVFVILKLCID